MSLATIGRTFRSLSGAWYAYDGNTRAIVQLDRLSASLIRFRAWPGGGRNLERLRAVFGADAVAARCTALDTLRTTRGIFRRSHRPTFQPPADPAMLAAEYQRSLAHVVLIVSDRCNLRCHYCCVHSAHYPEFQTDGDARMSWDVAKAALDLLLNQCANTPELHVGFYGGEALLELPLIERCVDYVLAHAGGRRVNLHVTTNGTAFTPRAIAFLRAHGFHLTVSLDGPQLVHDRSRVFRNGRGTWSRVIEGLGRIRSMDTGYFAERVTLNCVLARASDLGDVVRFFRREASEAAGLDVTINGVRVSAAGDFPPAGAIDAAGTRDLARLKQEFVDAVVAGAVLPDRGILRSLFVPGVYRIHRRRKAAFPAEVLPPLGQCVPGLKEFAVRPDGTLHTCVNTPRDRVLGDVRDGFDPGRVAETLRRFNKAITANCPDCWAVHLCGICLSNVGSEFDSGHLSAARCDEERAFLTEALELYASILERNPVALDVMFDKQSHPSSGDTGAVAKISTHPVAAGTRNEPAAASRT